MLCALTRSSNMSTSLLAADSAFLSDEEAARYWYVCIYVCLHVNALETGKKLIAVYVSTICMYVCSSVMTSSAMARISFSLCCNDDKLFSNSFSAVTYIHTYIHTYIYIRILDILYYIEYINTYIHCSLPGL